MNSVWGGFVKQSLFLGRMRVLHSNCAKVQWCLSQDICDVQSFKGTTSRVSMTTRDKDVVLSVHPRTLAQTPKRNNPNGLNIPRRRICFGDDTFLHIDVQSAKHRGYLFGRSENKSIVFWDLC